MLYLKNTLGGLSRSLHDSALQTFHGPYRWLKLALYVVMFVLPGGSLGVMFFAWLDHRRNARATGTASAAAPLTLPANARASALKAAAKPVAQPAALGVATACQPRAEAPACRAAAGKQARQTPAAELRC
ncbi:hypothetical protein P3T43_002159 [Paraburkholderia sp. GAS41]|jgi:hypothetical protein|uniref:hypothetical protein n=1 Tax=Paraburkholderia sp. GAS41 TaxID=3035134 RepID=UPI003D232818